MVTLFLRQGENGKQVLLSFPVWLSKLLLRLLIRLKPPLLKRFLL